MVKLVFCLRRLPHLSRAEFQRYWLEHHGPLVRGHATALGIRRYVQTHADHEALSTALAATRGAPEPYDGVAELWWDSTDALVGASATPAGAAAAQALLEDERRFIDHARSPIFVTTEHPLIGG